MGQTVAEPYRTVTSEKGIQRAGIEVRSFRAGVALVAIVQRENLLLRRVVAPVCQPGHSGWDDQNLQFFAERDVHFVDFEKTLGDAFGEVRRAEQYGLRTVLTDQVVEQPSVLVGAFL